MGPAPFCRIGSSLPTRTNSKSKRSSSGYPSRRLSRHSTVFLVNLNKQETNVILEQSRNRIRFRTGFLTEHCHFRKHVVKLGLKQSINYRLQQRNHRNPFQPPQERRHRQRKNTFSKTVTVTVVY